MSIRAVFNDGVFKPLDTVTGIAPGEICTLFPMNELRDLRGSLGSPQIWEKSFEFWQNEEDAFYDTL